jgi:carbamoyl-phosphate synthase large subunit
VFISVADRDKQEIVPLAGRMAELGYELLSTRGTATVIRQAGVHVREIPKIQEGRPNLLDLMKNDDIALVINTPSGKGFVSDEAKIRTTAVVRGVPCITTMAAAHAAVDACAALRRRELTVLAIQDRYPRS